MINGKPLAFILRPQTLDEVIGQNDLVGKDGFLRKSIESHTLFSIVFFGPPGSGKTTIAECYARSMDVHYIKLNAVTSDKKDLINAIEECKHYKESFIIMDEVHRMNKDKQDILLPFIEDGTIFLLGATTANPYISINQAIRSRVHLLEVKNLSKEDIVKGLKRAVEHKDGLNNKFTFDTKALEYIASITNGDMRYALNFLEVLSMENKKRITLETVQNVYKVPNYVMDKNDEEHYDTVSALQKSIRGSDVDAALYYLARLCISNDLESIARRLIVTAYEDIGLANPQAVDRCHNAIETAKQVGFPEAIIPLGFAVCDLALSPKSKASCLGIEKAMDYVSKNPSNIMDYLKLTPINVMEEDKYPYDRPDLWEKIQYLPNMIKDMKFFEPSYSGNYDKALAQNYERLKKIKRSSNLRELKKSK